MIDSQNLADLVLQEARLQGGLIRFDDAPQLGLDEKFSRATAEYPLPNDTAISSVLEEVFWASLLTEESRPCRPRLLYCPTQENTSGAVHWLERPVPLSRDTLRKLTPVQGPLGYLTWDCASEKPQITGIQGRQDGDPCDLIIASPNNGALDISWWCMCIVALRAGRIYRLSENSQPDVVRALTFVQQLLGSFGPVFLLSAIRAIAGEGHGGAVWILRENRDTDGVQVGRPIRRDERPLPGRHEQRSRWLESVGHLAAVDGAVLLDSRLRVLGFGAFIDVSGLAERGYLDSRCKQGRKASIERPRGWSPPLGGRVL
jgi:hypothetical protein